MAFNTDLMSIAILAFFTELGTGLGTNLAVRLLDNIERKAKQAKEKIGAKL